MLTIIEKLEKQDWKDNRVILPRLVDSKGVRTLLRLGVIKEVRWAERDNRVYVVTDAQLLRRAIKAVKRAVELQQSK
jgi:hypothetical protein